MSVKDAPATATESSSVARSRSGTGCSSNKKFGLDWDSSSLPRNVWNIGQGSDWDSQFFMCKCISVKLKVCYIVIRWKGRLERGDGERERIRERRKGYIWEKKRWNMIKGKDELNGSWGIFSPLTMLMRMWWKRKKLEGGREKGRGRWTKGEWKFKAMIKGRNKLNRYETLSVTSIDNTEVKCDGHIFAIRYLIIRFICWDGFRWKHCQSYKKKQQ